MELVPMAEAHLDQLAQLEACCFSQPWTRQGLAAQVENPAAHFLVAVEGEQVLGYFGLHWVLDEGDVANVAVLPKCRGQGIGRALTQAQIAWARHQGLGVLHLEVRPSNLAAIGLYQSLGFVQVGRRRGFYQDPPEDGLLMNLEL